MDITYYLSSTHEPLLASAESQNSQEVPLSPHSTTTRLFHLAVIMDMYYTPILFLFGTIGNCLSIIVFFSKSHNARGSLSSSVYLSALAISDTGFLINLLIMWLDNMGANLLTNSFICPTVMYLASVTGFLSVWFIVAFTIERFFAVCYPLFRPSQCTASRAKKIVMCLTIFATVAFSYVLVIAEVQRFRLQPEHDGDNSTLLSIEKMDKVHESMLGLTTPTLSSEQDVLTSDMEVNPTSNIVEGDTTYEEKDPERKNDWGNLSSREESQLDEPEFAYMCSVPEKYHGVSRVGSYIDSVLTLILPFMLIAILNLKIIFCVKRIKGHRESMLATASTKVQYRQCQKSSQPLSGQEEKEKLKGLFTTFRYTKKPAGAPKNGKRFRRHRDTAASSEKMEISASCSNCSNMNLNYPDQNGSKHVLKNRASSTQSDSPGSPPGPCEVTPPFKPVTKTRVTPTATEIRVTKTLLLVSSVFLLLHFPSHIIRVSAFIESIGSGSKETLQQLNVAQHWSNILFNTNFAINFLLYCCSGKAFRRSIKNLFSKDFPFRKKCTRSPVNNASTTMLTTQLTLHTDSPSCKYSTRVLRNQSVAGLEEDQL